MQWTADMWNQQVASSPEMCQYNQENFWSCNSPFPEYSTQDYPVKPEQDTRKCQAKKIRQRTAANQRERKRMRTINDAFDGLRCRIPDAKEDKKISKVDTLRMAISYIHKLTDLLKACDSKDEEIPSHKQPETVLIRYHNADEQPTDTMTSQSAQVTSQESYPLYGHTLSWKDSNPGYMGADQRMSAKIWIPEHASSEDIANL